MNILFVCSRNEWRSRTAETIFKNRNGIKVKSAGTSKTARIRISRSLFEWADMTFVMENKHKKIMADLFPEVHQRKEIIVLDIPDEYLYMDKELISHLEDAVPFYLNH